MEGRRIGVGAPVQVADSHRQEVEPDRVMRLLVATGAFFAGRCVDRLLAGILHLRHGRHDALRGSKGCVPAWSESRAIRVATRPLVGPDAAG